MAGEVSLDRLQVGPVLDKENAKIVINQVYAAGDIEASPWSEKTYEKAIEVKMTDEALTIVGVPHLCRVCGHEATIYCSAEQNEQGGYDVELERITQQRCQNCEQERPFTPVYGE